MPKKEINYQNTVIYKIQHTEKDDLIYVGHTTDFTKRKNAHKKACNNEGKKFNIKLYKMIRDNGGWDMFKMLEIKKFPCNDSREACAEEDKAIKELKANMNSRDAVVDKERIKEYKKSYYENNKESIAIKGSVYREENVEKIKAIKKSYYEENKERIKAEVRKYNEDNKDKINKSNAEIVQCECGCFMTRKNRGRTSHLQTQRHKNGMKLFAPTIV